MKISAIAVISKNRALGKGGGLLFHVPGDLPRFKKITSGHPVIMGRKTFESKEINKKPLPNRMNIVVSHSVKHNVSDKFTNCIFVGSIESALELAEEYDKNEVFIIGGGQIYKEAMPFVDKLYLTVVDEEAEGDTFFPDYSEFKKVVFREEHEEKGMKYTFLELEK